ncbi:3 beta-hydroxysteroid dehydrogenase type 7 (3 beta-hydroxysteroid dehydrogenase type VII) (3-beta-HSD VII) (3-beta-hydroxy-Delta(5)-C27 steroid oxidoreductase) (C(27) 3-beta-HSD) (Cholest-5-ene-3-beta [Durusdinium trenchii]|uniref:ELMO domain-containing protein n=1 Tax=Durusdinium trenchii TaxID=1381693 RepID=A0ABP0RQJ5_9DINO
MASPHALVGKQDAEIARLRHSKDRKVVKWVLHALTGKCEIERILGGEGAHSVRVSKGVARSVLLSTAMPQVRKVVFEDQDPTFDPELFVTMIADAKAMHDRGKEFAHLRACVQDMLAANRFIVALDNVRRRPVRKEDCADKFDRVWAALMPRTRRQKPEDWKLVGFQGSEPSTDLRGMGLLGLEAMVRFTEGHTDVARRLHQTFTELSFAVVMINIAGFTHRMFETRMLDVLFYQCVREQTSEIVDFEALALEIFTAKFTEFLRLFFSKHWQTGPRDILRFAALQLASSLAAVCEGKMRHRACEQQHLSLGRRARPQANLQRDEEAWEHRRRPRRRPSEDKMTARRPLVVSVTGGSGGVGSTICRLLATRPELVEHPVAEVRVVDLRAPSGSNFDAFKEGRKPALKFCKASITELDQVRAAIDGSDVVIHVASLIDFGQTTLERLMQVNVFGTRNLIRACRECNVQALVYTSSADTLSFWGNNVDLQSDQPYPVHPRDFSAGPYGFTKSLAENDILSASNCLTADEKTVMRTCALRFRGVFGEHDGVYIVNFLKARISGLLTFKVGSSKQDHIYNGDVAYAHICAMNALMSGDQERMRKVSGQPFNISSEEPCNVYVKLKPYFEAFNLTIPAYTAPDSLMRCIGWVSEKSMALVPAQLRPEVVLTSLSVEALTNEKTYRDPEARKRLGYKPLYTPEEATARTIRWLLSEWEERPGGPKDPARAASSGLSSLMPRIVLLVLLAILTRYVLFVQLGF